MRKLSRFILVLLAVGLGAPGFAAEPQDEDADGGVTEGETPATTERLPRIDELVPGITTEVPSLDELTQPPDRPYPNAADILRAMREIPPLERANEPLAQPAPPSGELEPSDTTVEAGAKSSN